MASILLLQHQASNSLQPAQQATSESAQGSTQLLAYLSSPKNQTGAGIMEVIGSGINKTAQLNVSYSGGLNIKTHGGRFGNVAFYIPLAISYEKYGSNSRLYFNASGIPIIGNLSGYEITLSNGTSYSCSAYSGGAFANLSSSSSGSSGQMTCQASSSSAASQYISQAGQISQSGSNVSVKVLGNAQYKGQACVLTRMSGSSTTANMSITYNVTMCLSDQYYVPLNITVLASTSGASSYGISLNLAETSIGRPVSAAGIAALPGPLSQFNSTLSSNQTTTVGLNYTAPMPFVNGTTTCTPPYGNLNTNCLGFTMNQGREISLSIETTDYNAYHVSVGCEISQYNNEPVNSGFPVYYAIDAGVNGLGTNARIGAANATGTASLIENTPLSFAGLPCTAESTVPPSLPPGSQVSGTIWMNYQSAQTGGLSETSILASFNTTMP